MSEKVANLNPTMPLGYEMFSGVEVVKQKDGELRYNGLLNMGVGDNQKQRRVELPQLEEIWNVDVSEAERAKVDPEGWARDRQRDQIIEDLQARVEQLEAQLANPGNRWTRITAGLGNLITGRTFLAATQVRTAEGENEQVPVIVAEETVTNVHPESRRRTGRATILGGVAVVGAGILGYYLGRHSGHNVINNYYDNITIGGNGGSNTGGQSADFLNHIHGAHVDPVNPNSGHQLTATALPKELHLVQRGGHKVLVDDNHKVVVGHLKKGLFDRQGNLSFNAREHLRTLGYKLTQLPFGKRFMTGVWPK